MQQSCFFNIQSYLNYGSFLPVDYKRGLIATLLHRTYTICSDNSKLHEEINRLKVIWQKNSFPLFFIDKCVKKFLDQLFFKKSSTKLPNKKEVMVWYGMYDTPRAIGA